MYISVQQPPKRKRYGVLKGLIDFTLFICTGGLWGIWMLVRFLRSNTR